jgi:hypothetical protein
MDTTVSPNSSVKADLPIHPGRPTIYRVILHIQQREKYNFGFQKMITWITILYLSVMLQPTSIVKFMFLLTL